jgi:two-component system sensor histidine kinase HydH
MASPEKNLQAEGKQFRLVKFFAFASVIVLIIFSFPLSVVISQQAKDILIKSYENYALLQGQNLNHQVYQNFMIPVAYIYEKNISLREKEQYELMDQVVKNTIHGFNIDLVNMYDIVKGVIAYSTAPELIGKKAKEGPGYKKALMGEHSSGMISKGDDFWSLKIGKVGGKKKIRTYIPFEGVNPFTGEENIFGIFELIQDLSKEYGSIEEIQYLTFGLSILIMGLIFVALLLIVHNAERIIRERAREQRELEAQLNQAERLAALGEMVAGVSHEIRNPLGIIRSTAELLGGRSDSDEAQRKLSNVIVEESGRLNDIVTEFLDFARPQEPNFQDCYLEEIINKNLNFLLPQFEKQDIRVENHLDGKSLRIKADPQLLYRAFLNVFVNAIQAMKDGGTLTVDLTEKKDGYVIQVEDTGSGVTQENLSKIFNPFFSTKEKGSGLGLSIVRNIMEGHRGSIHITSLEGSGTTITINLPKA